MYDNVVLKKIDSTATASGIVIVDSNNKPDRGVVVSVGPGKLMASGIYFPLGLELGDVVLFSPYQGKTVKLGDEELIVVSSDAILGVVSENEKEANAEEKKGE